MINLHALIIAIIILLIAYQLMLDQIYNYIPLNPAKTVLFA